MRIWYQSGGGLSEDTRYKNYWDALKGYLNEVARPGTEVSVHAVERCSPNNQASRYEELLHDYQVVENLLKAQAEGYDAFCVGCIFDPGFYAIREVADIPFCSLGEASMLLACLLSPNFSLLCHNKLLLLRVIEMVKRYGLQDRFIECNILHIERARLYQALDDPKIMLEPAREVAREAARKGVCMLVNADGLLNMILARHNVHQIEGVPVLHGGGALIKMAEMLVDLKSMGIRASQLGLYTPLPKEDLAAMRKLYGVG